MIDAPKQDPSSPRRTIQLVAVFVVLSLTVLSLVDLSLPQSDTWIHPGASQANTYAKQAGASLGVLAERTPATRNLLDGTIDISGFAPDAELSAEESPGDFLEALQEASRRITRRENLNEQLILDLEATSGKRAKMYLYALDPDQNIVIASVDADQKVVAASTYKLFVAYSMILAVEKREISWDQAFLGGMSLGECFEVMITESNNECAEEWLDVVGPKIVQKQVEALGLHDTQVKWSEMETTARDLAVFLDLLLDGNIVSQENRALLLEYMEEQEFREGIPGGVPAKTAVADKVGFLEEYLHDAAIIDRSGDPLILVILTSGASWDAIASLTKVVLADVAVTHEEVTLGAITGSSMRESAR